MDFIACLQSGCTYANTVLYAIFSSNMQWKKRRTLCHARWAPRHSFFFSCASRVWQNWKKSPMQTKQNEMKQKKHNGKLNRTQCVYAQAKTYRIIWFQYLCEQPVIFWLVAKLLNVVTMHHIVQHGVLTVFSRTIWQFFNWTFHAMCDQN